MISEIDGLSKEEIIEKINKLDLLIERIRDEVYENHCKSDEKWLEDLKERHKELIEKRDKFQKK